MSNETEKTEGKEVTKKQLTIRELMESEVFKVQIARALPRHLTADRFVRVALTTLIRNPKLQQCTQASFFNALLTLSQLGIEPDGRRAHLIPFENRKNNTTECQLIIDYKGLAELAYNTNQVSFIHADVVCENDDFEYDKGQIKKHIIDLKTTRGNPYAAYAIVKMKDGTEKCEVMTEEEIEKIRKRSRAAEVGPWVTDWNEMAKKTVFRRLSKWIPLSPEQKEAIEVADRYEFPQYSIPERPLIEMPQAKSETEKKKGRSKKEKVEESKSNTQIPPERKSNMSDCIEKDPLKCDCSTFDNAQKAFCGKNMSEGKRCPYQVTKSV
ncbi:MAG: recombinase RecT [Bacillota bacterium]